uniref:Uncharacterized protein n=1 Tax=Picocystis salinarum TaxID=88271 RepID=A0A6U9SEA4_9CHLO
MDPQRRADLDAGRRKLEEFRKRREAAAAQTAGAGSKAETASEGAKVERGGDKSLGTGRIGPPPTNPPPIRPPAAPPTNQAPPPPPLASAPAVASGSAIGPPTSVPPPVAGNNHKRGPPPIGPPPMGPPPIGPPPSGPPSSTAARPPPSKPASSWVPAPNAPLVHPSKEQQIPWMPTKSVPVEAAKKPTEVADHHETGADGSDQEFPNKSARDQQMEVVDPSQQVESLKNTLAEREKKEVDLREELRDVGHALQAEKDSRMSEQELTRATIAQKDEEIASLQQKCQRFEQLNTAIQGDDTIALLQDELKILKQQLHDTVGAKASQEDQLSKLNDEFIIMQQEADEMRTLVSHLQEQVSEKEGTILRIEEEKNSLIAQVESKQADTKLQSMQEQIKALQEEKLEYQRQVQEHKKVADTTTAEKQEYLVELEKLIPEVERARKKNSKLEKELTLMQQHSREQEIDIERLQAELTARQPSALDETEHQPTQEVRERLEGHIAQLESELQSLQEKLTDKDTSVLRHARDLQALEEAFSGVEQERDAASQTVHAQRQELQEQKQLIEELQGQVSEKNQQIAVLQGQVGNEDAANRSSGQAGLPSPSNLSEGNAALLKSQLMNMETEMMRLRTERDSLRSELETERSNIADLQIAYRSLASSQQNRESKRTSLSNKKDEDNSTDVEAALLSGGGGDFMPLAGVFRAAPFPMRHPWMVAIAMESDKATVFLHRKPLVRLAIVGYMVAFHLLVLI